MGALPQALEILFEVQIKRSNEKITRRKISFPTYKLGVFFFPPLWAFPIFKLHNFFLFFILNDLKRYRSVTRSFTN
jgi:hypothetical protein